MSNVIIEEAHQVVVWLRTVFVYIFIRRLPHIRTSRHHHNLSLLWDMCCLGSHFNHRIR